MSGVISYVIDRISGRGAIDIPRRILEVVFRDEWMDKQGPVSIESKILMWVIKDRVIRDTDLIHGEEILVDLYKLAPVRVDEYAMIYVIPPEMTNNREIVSCINVSYVPFGAGVQHRGGTSLAFAPMMTNDLTSAASQVMNSVGSIPNVSTARVDIVGHNTVRVTDRQRLQQAYVLRCYVGNDSFLNNISPRAYDTFAKLCTLALKAYCYNHIMFVMGDHYLERGKELGVFKQTIERWEESAEQYWEFLNNTWGAVAYMQDEDAYTRYISYQIPTGL